MRLLHHRPSPALLLALIALFVALGGASYAAVTINGKSIKNGTITGKKIKNRTLTTKKLSTSAVKSLRGQTGARGTQGPQGLPGSSGAKGDKGDKGDPGPSAAFSAHREAISPPVLPASADTTVVTLAVPAGKYAINAKVDMDEISGAKHV